MAGLAQNVAWSRKIAESLQQLVWICAPNGDLVYGNSRLLAYVGVDLAAIAREGWLDYIHADDRALTLEVWQRALSGSLERHNEARLRRNDGAYRWFDVQLTPLYGEDGTVAEWFGCMTDIHDRREVSDTLTALRIEQERLESVAAASPQILHSFRQAPDGTLTYPYVSPAFVRLFGASAEEVARDARRVLGFTLPEDLPALLASVEESARRMTPWRHEWRVEIPDRGEVWLEGHSMPVRNPDGGVTWHGTMADVTERKRNEAALRESELRLRQLADSIDHAFWMIEMEPVERVSYVSPAFGDIWGFTPEELYAAPRRWLESIHPDDRPRVAAANERWRVAPFGQGFQAEYRVVRPDGSVRWVLDRGHGLRDELGRVRLAGLAVDITERKQAEEALRESNERFQQIAETLNHIFWVVDLGPPTRISYLSPAADGIWQRPREYFYEDPARWLLHVDDRDRARAEEARKRWVSDTRPDQVLDAEYRIRRADGTVRWFHDTGRAQRDASGKPVRLAGVAEDITERKLAEQELSESRAKLAAVIDNLTEGVVTASLDGVLTHWNRAALDMHGLASAEDTQRPLAYFQSVFDLSSPDGRVLPFTEWPFSRILRGEKPKDYEVVIAHRQEGWKKTFSYSGSLVRDDQGEPLLGVVLVSDITERVRAHQEILRLNTELEQRVAQRTAELELANRRLVSTNDELEAANRELEAFSYSVSHDLRAPLRAIRGFSQALLDDFGDALPDQARRFAKTIRDGALRMGQLIDDLLALSRLGRQSIVREVVDTGALVRECLSELGQPPPHGGVEISVGALPPCNADRSLLRQVFLNLLSNAFKYSRHRAPARVEIGSRRDDSGALVYFVRDNGTGFDMQYAPRLFQVFQRLHRDDEFEGTGIGLAIVRRIVTRHGGRVWAEATPDGGATFSFTVGEPGRRAGETGQPPAPPNSPST